MQCISKYFSEKVKLTLHLQLLILHIRVKIISYLVLGSTTHIRDIKCLVYVDYVQIRVQVYLRTLY